MKHALPDRRVSRRRTGPATRRSDDPVSTLGTHLDIIDASPNAIIAVGGDGRIAYANPRALDTFGHSPADLIGVEVEQLIPERFHDRHREHRSEFLHDPLARPMGIGLELWGRRMDGSEFPVEISLAPLQTETGPLVFATVVDITARKEAERALAESERRSRAVLEASPNAVVAVGPDGRIMYANPRVAVTFGYLPDELAGKPVEMLIPDRVAESHVGHRSGYIAHPDARPMGIGLDLRARRKDGAEFPVEISLSPVHTPDGLLVFATIVDITGRKGLEGQLLQAQKMESIGLLAGGIAHDFNNMLSAIGGFADLLLEDLAAPEPPSAAELTQSVEAIRAAADRAIALTSQLLAFSRKQVVAPRILDLNTAVANMEPMLRRLIGERVDLVMKLAPETGSFRGDAGQLDQILMNLVVNARDALDGAGKVTIETSSVTFDQPYVEEHFDVAPGEYVLLVVTDTGRGMDQPTQERIFEPFFTTKDRGSGTGLGLSTTYGIVHQASGHIWVYSEPGKGTTFKIYFPRVVDAPSAAPPGLAPAATRGSGTVLVVEDEAVVRDYAVRVLDRAGYEVTVAASAEEALRLFDDGLTVDTLVSDVVMPGLSGTDLAARVLERFPGVAVVLASGYTEETLDLAEAMERGVSFLPKPYTPTQLVAAIATAVGLAAARVEGTSAT